MKIEIDLNILLKELGKLSDDASKGRYIVDAAMTLLSKEKSFSWATRSPTKKRKRFNGYTDDFESFWKSYPRTRRTGKLKAFEAWSNALETEPDLYRLCLQALSWQVFTKQWKDGFVPMPATYLNGRRWEDEEPKFDGFTDLNGVYHEH